MIEKTLEALRKKKGRAANMLANDYYNTNKQIIEDLIKEYPFLNPPNTIYCLNLHYDFVCVPFLCSPALRSHC
mgnify:CR=1 FL=1